MEIGNKKYVFVINNTIIKEGKVIFQVSTKDIKYGNLNKLSKIKTGYFKNVRFDIDSTTWSNPSCSQVNGYPCNPSQCDAWQKSGNVCPTIYVYSGYYLYIQSFTFIDTCDECCHNDTGDCFTQN